MIKIRKSWKTTICLKNTGKGRKTFVVGKVAGSWTQQKKLVENIRKLGGGGGGIEGRSGGKGGRGIRGEDRGRGENEGGERGRGVKEGGGGRETVEEAEVGGNEGWKGNEWREGEKGRWAGGLE